MVGQSLLGSPNASSTHSHWLAREGTYVWGNPSCPSTATSNKCGSAHPTGALGVAARPGEDTEKNDPLGTR